MSVSETLRRTVGLDDGSSDKGHLYMQTNEVANAIIQFNRGAGGTLTEVARFLTGGAGSGGYNPLVGLASTPNPFEGARSVILSPNRERLFATNGGDNSVSSFEVDGEGGLRLIDVKRTGNVVAGRSGSAKALAYNAAAHILYVTHELGPDHLRLMSVDEDGRLSALADRRTVNTPDKPNRVATTATLSPDGKFLLVGTTFDQPPTANPDGSPDLWAVGEDGTKRSIASNAPDPDGLVVFAVDEDGRLGEPSFQDGGGGSPWFPLFLNHRPDHFVIGYAVADGASLAKIDSEGNVATGPVVTIDTSLGKPSELCWMSISPDDRTIYATNFGYSNLSSYHLDGDVLSVAQDPACPAVPGDGTFRALDGDVSSGPNDNWLSPDGAYLYQIYGNASVLVGYATAEDGSLEEVTRIEIPYNGCQGLDGF